MNELPEGWASAIAEDLTRFVRGVSYKKHEAKKQAGDGLTCVLRANNFNTRFDLDDLVFVPDSNVSGDQKLQMHDLLFAMSSGSKSLVGKSVLVRKELNASFGAFCGVLRPLDIRLGDWIALAFSRRDFRYYIEKLAAGTNINNLKKEHLADFPVHLPPLAEQRRIVEKVDTLFAELEAGVESLERAKARLALYRKSVLDQLTNGTRAKSGAVTTLGHVIDSIGQGWSPRCENVPSPSPDEWGVIKTTAIQAGYFDETENKKLPSNLDPRTHLELQDGDLLITRAGPRKRVGVACLVRKPRPRLILCDKAYRLSVRVEKVDPAYLEAVLNSPSTQQDIEELKSGINDSGLNLTQVRFLSLEFHLPDLDEQREIIAEIEAKMSNINALEIQIEEDLSRAKSLRQSILKRAFSGKLVEQDSSDEPASVLLERIRAEKEEARKSKRKRKT